MAGSGVLQNPAEVLTAEQRRRLQAASRSESVIPIIGAAEAVSGPVAGSRSWRFRARNVRDVAWAAAPDFRWDATSWNGILCQAFYPARAGKAWEAAAEQTQWSIRNYSQLLFQYPYPQATSVAGPVGGMEYPMFVMVHYGEPLDDPASIFGTIDHEHGHEWFPMIVGSNERRYAWMDEGFNTYINTFAKERRNPGSNVYAGQLKSWAVVAARTNIDSPLMTAPDLLDVRALGAVGYRKPAVALLALRNNVIGASRFDAAFKEYARDWAFKHPTPGDFFRSIENQVGEDLSWFWRGFFYSTELLDIGIERVIQRDSAGESLMTISLVRSSPMVFPVELRVGYADGTTQDFSLPVQIWAQGSRFEAALPARGRVTGARLWPHTPVPDWGKTNDTWGVAPPADPPGPVTH